MALKVEDSGFSSDPFQINRNDEESPLQQAWGQVRSGYRTSDSGQGIFDNIGYFKEESVGPREGGTGGEFTVEKQPAGKRYESDPDKNRNYLDQYMDGWDKGDVLLHSYDTPLLTGRAWDLEEILNTEGITLDRLRSKALNTSRININRAPSQVDFTNFGKMYVFFTKPDLHIFVDNKFTVNPSIVRNCPDLHMRIVRNIAVAAGLQSSLNSKSSNTHSIGFNYLLGNLCNSLTFPEVSVSTEQGPKNQKGYGISYLGDFWESLQEGDIEIEFIDTRDRDVSTQLEIWQLYAEGVRNGLIYAKEDYIGKNIIDYACTIFVLTCDESNSILAHGSLVGVFPRTFNTTLLNYKAEMLTAQDFIGPHSYTFHVSHVDKPNSHRITEAFNYVSGYKSVFIDNAPKRKSLSSNSLMYKKTSNGYYHHSGIVMDTGYLSQYPYHYTLLDKWAEMVGISFNVMSSGAVVYALAFASRDLGKPVSVKGLWKLGETEPIRSRWYNGTVNKKGSYSGWNANGYGWLENINLYEPFTSNGTKGFYQHGWQDWNEGSGRYGKPTNAGTTRNHANFFRQGLGLLGGFL